MIPKRIHYCWFGRGTQSDLVIRCIRSWQTVLPHYEIIQWSEDNLDFSGNRFATQAFQARKWAFVADWARLKVLHDIGGIYLDADVEVLKPLDVFLHHPAFVGFEDRRFISAAVIGAEKENPWIRDQLSYYDDRDFVRPDGELDQVTNVQIITSVSTAMHGFIPNGRQQVLQHGVHLYPEHWLCRPKRFAGITSTRNVYAIHRLNGSWLPTAERRRRRAIRYLEGLIGKRALQYLVTVKHRAQERRHHEGTPSR